VLVVAEQNVTYVSAGGNKSSVSLSVPPWLVTAWGAVDRERFLLGDIEGGLHALLLSSSGSLVTGLKVEYLGTTSIAHRLQYVDNSFVLVGSQYGDSQLIKLHRTPQPLPGEEDEEQEADMAAADQEAPMEMDGPDAPAASASAAAASSAARAATSTSKRPNFISVESTFEHLGPIVDFVMLDLERNGQGAMLTCSGSYKDGSLRVVRNGIGVREEASIELPGIQGVWSLADGQAASTAAQPGEEAHRLLVQTFATETRVLALEKDEEGGDALQLAECEVPGFDANQRTLHCGNLAEGLVLQVTATSCRLVDATSLQLVDEWRLPSGAKLTVAASNSTQILLGAGKTLVLLTVQGRKFVQQKQVQMDEEISCVDITPLNGSSTAAFAAVCMWREHTVRVLHTSTLEEVLRERLGETVARSVLLAQFDAGTPDAASYLMCGLGDGALVSFELHPSSAAVQSRKKITLGTSGLELRSFWSGKLLHVFASCDRPSVVSCANGKLLYSNVNVNTALGGGVAHMAPFHAPGAFEHCLAMASSNELSIGHVDDIQKLHIQTVRTGGQPRRLAHHVSSRTVAVAVVERTDDDTPDDLVGEIHRIRLFDDEHFALHDTLTLQTNEAVLTVSALRLDTQGNAPSAAAASSVEASAALTEYLVVGTGFINPDEPEASAGRLLVLSVDKNASGTPSLRLVSSAAIKGAVTKVAGLQGRIVAGVNARVVVYRCVPSVASQLSSASAASSSEFRLEKRCDYSGNVLVLALSVSRDQQYVMVGDLMNGVRVLHYASHANANDTQAAFSDCSLSEVARHYEATWLTAMESFSDHDDLAIIAEHHHNLLTLRRQLDAQQEDERARIECVGRWHVGELINKIARGSLVMQLPAEPDVVVGPSSSATGGAAPFDRVVPTHLYGTLEGGIGVLAPLSAANYKFFARMEEELERVLRSPGNLSHRDWRGFNTDRRHEDSSGYIDGDLVEKFLLLSPAAQEAIAAKLDVRLADCIKRVEDVQRIH